MATAANPALIVFAWGNVSRADDGVGPMLAERIQMLQHPYLALFEDIKLQIEHATDMRIGVPVLFIDASIAIDQGFALQKLRPEPDHSVSTHALSPPALLRLFEVTMQQQAPPAYQLHVAGSNFELGDVLSDVSRRSVDAAWRFLRRMLAEPCNSWGQALEIASAESLPGRPI